MAKSKKSKKSKLKPTSPWTKVRCGAKGCEGTLGRFQPFMVIAFMADSSVINVECPMC